MQIENKSSDQYYYHRYYYCYYYDSSASQFYKFLMKDSEFLHLVGGIKTAGCNHDIHKYEK